MVRRIESAVIGGLLVFAVGCAGTSAEPQAPESDRVARGSAVERDGEASERPAMGTAQVYTKDELDGTGETELDSALNRLGATPR